MLVSLIRSTDYQYVCINVNIAQSIALINHGLILIPNRVRLDSNSITEELCISSFGVTGKTQGYQNQLCKMDYWFQASLECTKEPSKKKIFIYSIIPYIPSKSNPLHFPYPKHLKQIVYDNSMTTAYFRNNKILNLNNKTCINSEQYLRFCDVTLRYPIF